MTIMPAPSTSYRVTGAKLVHPVTVINNPLGGVREGLCACASRFYKADLISDQIYIIFRYPFLNLAFKLNKDTIEPLEPRRQVMDQRIISDT